LYQLERAGLAERRPHPQDRLAREVLITPKGRRILNRARELAAAVESDVLQGLSPAERRQLVTLLRKAFAAAPQQPPWSSEEACGVRFRIEAGGSGASAYPTLTRPHRV
jgi:hypothetical protein